MRYDGSKFTVKMSREPVLGFECVQDVPGRRRPQPVLLNLVPEVLLVPEQPVHVAVVVHAAGPVVT